jgi:parvulin-like peptidyl-prolyl isomerase
MKAPLPYPASEELKPAGWNSVPGPACLRRILPPADRSRILHLFLAGLLGLLVASCAKQAAPKTVLATVGSRPITAEDVRSEVERRQKAHQPVPEKSALLQEMVAHEALLQRARQAGLESDPDVRREMENLLIGQLKERELTPRLDGLPVSEEEIQAAYQSNLQRYTRPAKVRLAILVLQANPKMSESKRAGLKARLQEARQRLEENPAPGGRGPAAQGFGALAIRYSDDQASRYRGGDIGWIDPDAPSTRWPRQVVATGCALQKNQVSELIETPDGLYLVMKTDHREAIVTPFPQVRESIRQSLLVQKQRDLRESFLEETVRGAAAVVDQKALAAFTLPSGRTAVAQIHEPQPPSLPGVDQAGSGQ